MNVLRTVMTEPPKGGMCTPRNRAATHPPTGVPANGRTFDVGRRCRAVVGECHGDASRSRRTVGLFARLRGGGRRRKRRERGGAVEIAAAARGGRRRSGRRRRGRWCSDGRRWQTRRGRRGRGLLGSGRGRHFASRPFPASAFGGGEPGATARRRFAGRRFGSLGRFALAHRFARGAACSAARPPRSARSLRAPRCIVPAPALAAAAGLSVDSALLLIVVNAIGDRADDEHVRRRWPP